MDRSQELNHRILVEKSSSLIKAVWNLRAEKTVSMSDVKLGVWREIVYLKRAKVLSKVIIIQACESYSMTAVYSADSL